LRLSGVKRTADQAGDDSKVNIDTNFHRQRKNLQTASAKPVFNLQCAGQAFSDRKSALTDWRSLFIQQVMS
jgi:hypothetical protein